MPLSADNDTDDDTPDAHSCDSDAAARTASTRRLAGAEAANTSASVVLGAVAAPEADKVPVAEAEAKPEAEAEADIAVVLAAPIAALGRKCAILRATAQTTRSTSSSECAHCGAKSHARMPTGGNERRNEAVKAQKEDDEEP